MEDDDISMLEEYSYSSVGEPFSLNVPNDSGAITFGLTPADGDGTTFNLTPATGDSTTFNLTPAVENYGAISPEGFGISSADDVQSFTLGQTIGVVQPINVYPSQHGMVAAQPLDTYPNMVPNQHPGTIQYHPPAQMHRHPQQPSPLHPQQPSPLHPQQPSSLHPQQPSPLHPQQPSPLHPQQASPIQPTSSSSHHPPGPMYQRPSNLQPQLQPVYSHELSNTINAMTFTPPIQPGTTSNFTPDFSSFLPLPPSPSNLPTHQSEPPRISLTEGASGDTSISLHSAYGLSNTISITRKQKLSPPLIPSQPLDLAPTTIPPHTATPPINVPVLMSANATSPRIISPTTHLQYSQVSPRGRGPQISPGASREPPSPLSNSRGAPPSPATSKHAPSSPRIPHSSPGSSPNPSFQNQPPGSSSPNRSFLNPPPGSSPNRSFLNQPPGSSPPNRAFLNHPPKSCSPNHSFLNHPPGSSPPNRSFVSQPPANSPNHSFLNQPSPRHMSMSPAVQPSPSHMSMSPPKQPSKTQIAPQESHPLPPAQIRPPPPPKKLPPAPVSEETIDPKDIPGVVMKKGNVDIGVFVNHIIQFKHSAFADGEGFAERCLTCIIRKMKNSLPALKNLEKATRSLAGEPDPGCVLIPRMKDGRITIAKTGAGVGGNKKIYPHLALVQIFRAPSAQNYGMLASCGGCTSPFAARGMGDFPDTEKVCISPLHYTPVTQDCNKTRKPHKSPVATPKKAPNFKAMEGPTVSHAAYVKSVALHNEGISVKAVAVHNEGNAKPVHRMEYMNTVSHGENRNNIPEAKTSMDVMDEDDDYEDFDDGGIDWEAKWEKEAIDADTDGIQSFNEEDMLKEIEYLTLSKDANGKAAIVKAERELLEKLKVLDDLRELINGNVNLDALVPIQEALHNEFKKDVISHGPDGPSSRNFHSRDLGIGSDGRGGTRPDTSIGSHGPNGPRRDIYTGPHGLSQDTAGGPNGPGSHGPNGPSRSQGHSSPSRGTVGGSHGPCGPSRGPQGPCGPSRDPQGPGGPSHGSANGSQGPSQRTLVMRDTGGGPGPTGPSSRTVADTKFQNIPTNATAKVPDESKEESAILNLLDDIKGSFERQFDMNLDDFGNDTEEHNFANQEFNMSNTFNITDFSSSGQPQDMLDSNSSNPPSDNLLQYRSSNMGSSDAMFGGGLMEEEGGLPCIINSWSVSDQPQAEVERGFLTAGTITQEQFYTNMFDQENS